MKALCSGSTWLARPRSVSSLTRRPPSSISRQPTLSASARSESTTTWRRQPLRDGVHARVELGKGPARSLEGEPLARTPPSSRALGQEPQRLPLVPVPHGGHPVQCSRPIIAEGASRHPRVSLGSRKRPGRVIAPEPSPRLHPGSCSQREPKRSQVAYVRTNYALPPLLWAIP